MKSRRETSLSTVFINCSVLQLQWFVLHFPYAYVPQYFPVIRRYEESSFFQVLYNSSNVLFLQWRRTAFRMWSNQFAVLLRKSFFSSFVSLSGQFISSTSLHDDISKISTYILFRFIPERPCFPIHIYHKYVQRFTVVSDIGNYLYDFLFLPSLPVIIWCETILDNYENLLQIFVKRTLSTIYRNKAELTHVNQFLNMKHVSCVGITSGNYKNRLIWLR